MWCAAVCFAWWVGSRDPTRPTKQTNNNTQHIHYVCCVLLVVLLGGSRARATRPDPPNKQTATSITICFLITIQTIPTNSWSLYGFLLFFKMKTQNERFVEILFLIERAARRRAARRVDASRAQSDTKS